MIARMRRDGTPRQDGMALFMVVPGCYSAKVPPGLHKLPVAAAG